MTDGPRTFQVLSLEDDDLDAELVRETLIRDGMRAIVRRATTKAEFQHELALGSVDVVLADFALPDYDGMAALEFTMRCAPDVPFIFVSGAIGEERAIETLRRGAADYVLKHRLDRLPDAVTHALTLHEERRRRRDAEAERDRLLIAERTARESAEAANRMKDEFLAVVSHELRTPLNAILGWASLLAAGQATPETLSKGLKTIQRNAAAQSRLIEDLLDISRIVTGKLQLRVARVAVSTFVSAAVEAVRPAAAAKNISLTVDLNRAGEIHGDTDRLQQVIWNLLSNAVKFTPPGGQVAALAERHPDCVVITVEDTGQGIESAFLPYVFERFRQADATITRRHAGLGLGLAIVRNLVELHGGTVTAESAGRGAGSCFRVRLPAPLFLEAEAAPDSERARDTVEPPPSVMERLSLGGIHALIVDDETDTRELMSLILRSAGARVTSVASVAEAVTAMQVELPTLIISDIGMPSVDGYAFMRRVRSLPPDAGGEIPGIAVTAYTRELDQAQATAAGYQRHLSKPVDPALLIAAVGEVAREQA